MFQDSNSDIKKNVVDYRKMEKLITVREAATNLKVSESTIYRLCARGLPHIKKSFGLRFLQEDLEKWLEEDKRKGIPLAFISQDKLTIPPHYFDNNMGGICELTKSKSKTRYNFGYGAIYQRKTKKGKIRWYLDYRDVDGERVQKVAALATTKEEAVLVLRDEVAKAFDKEYSVKREKKQIDFKEYAEIYLENYAKPKKRSWKSDYYYLSANLIPYFGEYLISKITCLFIDQYVVKRCEDGVQKSTINRELACLRKMFNKAIDWDYLEENPCRKEMFFSEKDNLKERVLSTEEERRLFESCSDHLRPILITAIQTGMRKSEILNLKWENVDFERKEIKVRNSKSGNPRFIPINEELSLILSRHKMMKGRTIYVFTNLNTGKALTDVKKAFNGACRRADIKGFRFHDLRHTFASRLVQRGVDLITVKDLLGHSSVKITERYTHSNYEQKRSAVEALSQKIGKNRENLLHICDTESNKELDRFVTKPFSVN